MTKDDEITALLKEVDTLQFDNKALEARLRKHGQEWCRIRAACGLIESPEFAIGDILSVVRRFRREDQQLRSILRQHAPEVLRRLGIDAGAESGYGARHGSS